MQRNMIKITLLLSLLLAMPALAQPTPEPAAKAPVTKAAPVAKAAPATPPAPAAPVAPAVAPKDDTKAEATKDAPAAPEAAETVKAAEEGMGYGAVAANHAIKLGFTLLSLLLSGLVFVLLKKFGFESQNAKIQSALEEGRAYAEQWSLKKAKLDGEPKPGGAAKMDQAISVAMSAAKEYKLPDKAKDWWETRLESWLNVTNGS